MRLPDFLVVGTMRGGSTTLLRTFAQHPDLFLADAELHYFDRERNFARGISWYASAFADAGDAKAVGEKTPAYCYMPYVPARIAEALPDVKLIWILRNPVDRAYSHYQLFISQGKERGSFEKLLADEPRRIERDYGGQGYVRRGMYAEQVRRYLQFFPMERMHFLFFEEFVTDPISVLGEACRFLGVDDTFDFDLGSATARSFLPRYQFLNWLAWRALRTRPPSEIHRALLRKNRRPGRYPPMARETRERLEIIFAPHNAELSALLGRDVPWAAQTSGGREAEERARFS